MSAACKTGYKYKPRGTSFKVEDFSLNWGNWPNLGIVVKHPRTQLNCVCSGTLRLSRKCQSGNNFSVILH